MRLRHLLVVLVLLVTPSALWAQAVSLLAPGIYRLDRDADAAAAALPSLSFEDAARRERLGRATDGPSVKPRFSTDDSGRQVVEINVAPGTDLYGTGMVAGPLLRTGRRTVAWNTDAYNYTEAFDSLYQSHPWVLAVRADGSAYGVLADTTYRCVIDLRDGIRFVADGPSHPVIIFEGRSPQQVIERLTDMIGRMPLPPKWTLGYHQCRYSYFPDRRAQEVASEFRKRDIPCDVIWHDIHYMHNNLNFTFDPEHFPDPAAHNAALHAMDFKTVWMINTGQGIRDENPVAKEMRERSLSVETASGEPFIGRVWPGDCLFPDFTRAEVRAWWGGLFRDFLAVGVDGVWNDMNEPAVFEGEGWTMPLDNIHRADENLGGTATHARYHNVYGMLMARSTREGILRARPDRRPFVLTRANFIGGHRYAAMWTGDNAATWEHVDWSITMALNLGLSGQPFAGPDIGGFKGSISGEMFARWMGIGAMLPFARGHTEVDSIDKEPWAFGPEVERTARLALERRYQHMPYL
ncbi:MAG: TIM-barrel domain-containing protein [Planctomycetota bacterium]